MCLLDKMFWIWQIIKISVTTDLDILKYLSGTINE
jgi:hypothetical protein